MLTKNFYTFMMAYMAQSTIQGGCVLSDGTKGNTSANTSSNTSLWNTSMKSLALKDAPTSSNDAGVRIGTGTTPATIDDYTLESIITSGMTVSNPSAISVTAENGFIAVYANYTVKNTGTSAVSISEIGLYTSGYFTGKVVPALMDRTVLEEPIVVNPGESKPLTYTIRMNYPTV